MTNDKDALAMFDFHESRAGVRGLVESGVTTVPGLFLAPTAPISSAAKVLVAPSVDLSLPRSDAVALVGAAARSCGFFQVTNHGIPAGTLESALSAVRVFNEQPLAARSAYYSASAAGDAAYTTVPIPPRNAGQPANAPLMHWRDTLILHFGHAESHLDHLPAACVDVLLEYHWSLTALGKLIASMLSEALGVGGQQLDRAMQVQGTLMQCHYYPPCPQPERVVGSRVHTDADLFTVLAQDGVGGLQVLLDVHEDAWVDVVPVTGALLVNIGDVLKVHGISTVFSLEVYTYIVLTYLLAISKLKN